MTLKLVKLTLCLPAAFVVVVFAASFTAVFTGTTPVDGMGCIFTSAKAMTLSTQIATSETAVLARWVGNTPAKLIGTGSTDFEVVEVLREQAKGSLRKGSKICLNPDHAPKSGNLFLVCGTFEGGGDWDTPVAMTQAACEYLKDVCEAGDQAVIVRLAHCLKYLEHSDHIISKDAFDEFDNASFAEVAQLRRELSRENLRNWLTSDKTAPDRLGLYAMMLGLCGNEDDGQLLERKILEPAEDVRLGIEGVMSGYLLISGERGLSILEASKLTDKRALFSETYAAMQAVRFIWKYGNGRIEVGRLRQSMMMMLDRPELADLVITDLARMKDWSSQDHLMQLYDAEAYNIPSVKRAIVRFTISAISDMPPDLANAPDHVVKAQKCLADLEKRDPKTVQDAKRFLGKK